VVVGMPVRNEAATLAVTLTNVLTALEVLRRDFGGLEVELIVCCNGCVDGSEVVAREVLDRGAPSFPVRVVTSAPGLLEALGRVVEEGGDADVFMFFDADILVMPDCASRLYGRLAGDSSVQVAYARARPLVGDDLGALERFLFVPFRHRGLFAERTFFRGAAYAIRADRVRDPELAGLIPGVGGVRTSPRPARRRAPVSDDGLLSHTVVHRYGTSALYREAGALVYLTPPTTFRDTFLGLRRRHHDQRTLDAAFREHRRWRHRTFRTRVKWSYLATQPLRGRLELVAYLIVRGVLSAAAWVDTALSGRGLPSRPRAVFVQLSSTKRLDLAALPAAMAATARLDGGGPGRHSERPE
jgi:glycosyltransferase involved in cell wall biosynthesis